MWSFPLNVSLVLNQMLAGLEHRPWTQHMCSGMPPSRISAAVQSHASAVAGPSVYSRLALVECHERPILRQPFDLWSCLLVKAPESPGRRGPSWSARGSASETNETLPRPRPGVQHETGQRPPARAVPAPATLSANSRPGLPPPGQSLRSRTVPAGRRTRPASRRCAPCRPTPPAGCYGRRQPSDSDAACDS